MNKGQLKSWNDSKGYGFIKSESLGRDIFVHISSLKSMSRKPKVGDFIYFDVEKQSNGKDKATNCRIEGVIALNKGGRNNYPKKKSNTVTNLLSIIVVLVIALFGYQKLSTKIDKNTPSSNITPQTIKQSSPTYSYRCDGRQHCSQMNSRAEAVYFIRNCPNTKMDGDHDGIPCENDSRF
jgi:cold shock CspA family protein